MSLVNNHNIRSWDGEPESYSFSRPLGAGGGGAYLAGGAAAAASSQLYADEQDALPNMPIALKIYTVVSNFFNEIGALFMGLKAGISSFFWAITHQVSAREEAYEIRRWLASSTYTLINRPTTFEAIYEVVEDSAIRAYHLHKDTLNQSASADLDW